LRQRAADFEAAGVEVLVITFEATAVARRLRERLGSPFRWLTDPQREAYRAYGMAQSSLWSSLAPATMAAYLRAMLHGHLPHGMGSDLKQLGGDFVADAEGRLALVNPQRDVADRPSAAALLAAAGAPASGKVNP